MWAKARFLPRSRHSTRHATYVGERLHFDVFSSSFRSDDGCKYMLVVVDEYSGYVWAYGMRKKSETMMLIQHLIKVIEKKMKDGKGVAAVRCDNGGENVLAEMQKWMHERGIEMETAVPHTPYQNGLVERIGGVVWKGGAALWW